jgi:hypothetical protein
VYCHEAKNLANFIRRLAVNYISRGYYYCVKGEIREHKDPAKTDQKIINHYDIARSKWAKARLRKRGQASVQYVRYERQFVILATQGEHRFFVEEAKNIRDVRRVPLVVGGYSISYRQVGERARVSVRITHEDFQRLKAHFVRQSVRSSVEELAHELLSLSVLRYAATSAHGMKRRKPQPRVGGRRRFSQRNEMCVGRGRVCRSPIRPFCDFTGSDNLFYQTLRGEQFQWVPRMINTQIQTPRFQPMKHGFSPKQNFNA